MKLSSTCFLAICLLFPLPSFAQNINLLPQGQTLISLSVTERIQVQQDLLVASLRVESNDRDAVALQNRINVTMEQALDLARAVSEVKVSTGFYSVYQTQTQPQGGRVDTQWQGSQSLTLESSDAQKLLELVGRLQAMGFLMNQLSYQLSSELENEVRDSLLEVAITRVQEKVERAGRALGKSDIDIATLDVDSSLSYGNPVMMRSARADMAEMASPVAEAGETEVSLTVRVQAVAR